jgi:hypothetical protein
VSQFRNVPSTRASVEIAVVVMPDTADKSADMPLAYLPQRVAEVMFLTVAVPIFAKGLQVLVTGRMREWAWIRDRAVWRVRIVGLFLSAIAAALAIFGFVVPAEPPHSHFRNHWGGPLFEVLLGIWLTAILGGSLYSFWRKR